MTQAAFHQLHFRDERAPEEIRVELERKLMVLLHPVGENGQYVVQGRGKSTGAISKVTLSLDEVCAADNLYTLKAEFDWTGSDPVNDEYFANSSRSWFEYWTRDFQAVPLPGSDDYTMPRYRMVADKALHFERSLATPENVQAEIVRRMKDGHQFATSHKEGGTVIRWLRDQQFQFSDYGESNETRLFKSEADFLRTLRQYFDMEVSRPTYPDQPDDMTAWTLILRLLYMPTR